MSGPGHSIENGKSNNAMKEKLFATFSSSVDAETHKAKKSILKIRLIDL